MSLKFKGEWRFSPPKDGQYITEKISGDALAACLDLVWKTATQGERQNSLEHFKGYFCEACGATHVRSTSTSWAETDLENYAQQAAQNAPLFIEALYEACQTFARSDPDRWAPDAAKINAVLAAHNVGYEINPPRLALRGEEAPVVSVVERPPTLDENVGEIYRGSLRRSETLLAEGRGREAVQESLWLLESVATAFRGVETATGTVEGKYFNDIVKDLRRLNRGTTLAGVLRWLEGLHSHLSDPVGGGVRHGLDLRTGVTIEPHEARLYCNLIKSYLGFLMSEHERGTKKE